MYYDKWQGQRIELNMRIMKFKPFLIPVLLFVSGVLLGGLSHRIYVMASPYIAKMEQCHSIPTPTDFEETEPLSINNNIFTLTTRTYVPAGSSDYYTTERDGTYNYSQWKLDLNTTALILMDVWGSHPNKGWEERAHNITVTKIVPLLELARKHKMLIIYSPNGGTIDTAVCPQPGEINLDDAGLSSTNAFHEFLKAKGIKTLLYAGYASNYCLLVRPSGIFWMAQLDYNIILIRDATIVFETAETVDGEYANKVVINMVESEWGRTTTVDDLQNALGK
jgi:nicotinamidase-related amidase